MYVCAMYVVCSVWCVWCDLPLLLASFILSISAISSSEERPSKCSVLPLSFSLLSLLRLLRPSLSTALFW